MKFKFLLLTLIACLFSFAQNKGTVSGVISDKDLNNEPLAFANVMIKGTTIGTSTDTSGKYSLSVEAGNHILVISFIGYETIEVPVTIKANETITINKTIGSGSVKLEDIIVKSAGGNREKETALLLDQKNAVEMKQAIGAQELSRKGVSDAAGAVAKTAGVSEQEGVKNVFVRGLADRYNSTSLNGLPLPSEDPEYKNISLKFFSTNIIKNVNVNKVFTSNLYGDVGGANIDIASSDLEQSQLLSLSIGNGFNSNAIGTNFLVADGYNYFGILKNGSDIPISDLNTYGFETSSKPLEKNNTINSNFSIVAGKKFEFANNKSLSVFGVILSNSDYIFKEGKVGQVNSYGEITQDLDFKKYDYSASQAGLGNLKYKFGSGKSIVYNVLYIHDSNQSVGDYNGFSTRVKDDAAEGGSNSFIRRQQVNNNALFSNQLLFDYKISSQWNTNFGASYNTIDGSEPDRRTNSYEFDEQNNNYLVGTNSSALNNRFFSKLKEDDFAGRFEVTYTLNPDEDLIKKIAVGANYRNTDRRFDYTQFNFDAPRVVIDINNPDAFFNQASVNAGKDNGGFDIETGRGTRADALDPFYYTGKREIFAAYAQVVYPINDKLTLQAGIRNENVDQIVEWDTNISSSVTDLTIEPSIIKENYLLPSLVAKYNISENNILRLAVSQTYTYPQFKETAPFLYEDVNLSNLGNPDLIPSKNLNFDIKYDFYLSKKEIISLGTFYKQIQDPINRIRVASAANEFSYVNLGDAFATGFEIEARKSIIDTEGENRNSNLAFGLNLSYLYTNQKIIDNPNDEFTILKTNDESKLEGASPLLINSDISYTHSSSYNALTSSLVFNYFYDKVYSIGTSTNENIVERAIPTLDFVNKFEFKKSKLGINLSFRNILNPTFKLTQQTTNNGITSNSIVSSYKKGFFASFGLFWNL